MYRWYIIKTFDYDMYKIEKEIKKIILNYEKGGTVWKICINEFFDYDYDTFKYYLKAPLKCDDDFYDDEFDDIPGNYELEEC